MSELYKGVEQIPAFRTSDGTVFSNETEAEMHEKSLNDEARIAQFLDGSEEYSKRGQRTRAENIIRDFLKYDRANYTPNQLETQS